LEWREGFERKCRVLSAANDKAAKEYIRAFLESVLQLVLRQL